MQKGQVGHNSSFTYLFARVTHTPKVIFGYSSTLIFQKRNSDGVPLYQQNPFANIFCAIQ